MRNAFVLLGYFWCVFVCAVAATKWEHPEFQIQAEFTPSELRTQVVLKDAEDDGFSVKKFGSKFGSSVKVANGDLVVLHNRSVIFKAKCFLALKEDEFDLAWSVKNGRLSIDVELAEDSRKLVKSARHVFFPNSIVVDESKVGARAPLDKISEPHFPYLSSFPIDMGEVDSESLCPQRVLVEQKNGTLYDLWNETELSLEESESIQGDARFGGSYSWLRRNLRRHCPSNNSNDNRGCRRCRCVLVPLSNVLPVLNSKKRVNVRSMLRKPEGVSENQKFALGGAWRRIPLGDTIGKWYHGSAASNMNSILTSRFRGTTSFSPSLEFSGLPRYAKLGCFKDDSDEEADLFVQVVFEVSIDPAKVHHNNCPCTSDMPSFDNDLENKGMEHLVFEKDLDHVCITAILLRTLEGKIVDRSLPGDPGSHRVIISRVSDDAEGKLNKLTWWKEGSPFRIWAENAGKVNFDDSSSRLRRPLLCLSEEALKDLSDDFFM